MQVVYCSTASTDTPSVGRAAESTQNDPVCRGSEKILRCCVLQGKLVFQSKLEQS